MKLAKLALSLLLFTALIGSSGNAIRIFAKAELAQYLIARSWNKSLATDTPQPPWAWSDTWPVARLQHQRSQTDLMVLAGADGSALAFGPGHLASTALPGRGTSVIAGHRDTHFAFLDKIATDDVLRLQDSSGEWRYYQIVATEIRNSDTDPFLVPAEGHWLVLVTCYPFNSLQPGGPLRYIVTARPIESNANTEPHVAHQNTVLAEVSF